MTVGAHLQLSRGAAPHDVAGVVGIPAVEQAGAAGVRCEEPGRQRRRQAHFFVRAGMALRIARGDVVFAETAVTFAVP